MADDGWTQVPRKSKQRVNASNHLPPSPQTIMSNIDRTNPPSRDLKLGSIFLDYEHKLFAWRSSQCRQATLRILDRVRPDDGWHIGKAVCLASGSFSRDNLECRRRSMWQLVIFADIAKHVSPNAHMFAQDPAYTALDREFLKQFGVEVLEADLRKGNGLGQAEEWLGKETFVFEPFLDMDAVMMKQVLNADVALYVGSSIRGLMNKMTEVGVLAKQFHETHEMYNFPEFELNPNVLGGMGIYWKEEEDDEA